MQLLDVVRRTLRRHELADARTRVVVALSGGGDSVALAYLVRELAETGELRLAGLAHLNHQLRATAARDEQWCGALAARLSLPIIVGRDDVAGRARREHRSVEDAAHEARLAFFERARIELDADVVAVGHTLDDQAETFLLRLIRGAGPKGLGGMHPRSGCVIRPLLECRRADVRALLVGRGLDCVEDETNADVAIPRNRVRAELLPLLESRFNGSIVGVLAREAEVARDDWAWIETEARQLLFRTEVQGRTKDQEPRTKDYGLAPLLAAPPALRRAAVWMAMRAASGGRPVGFEHVDAVMSLLADERSGWALDMPGHRVERIGDCLVLTCSPSRERRRPANLFRHPLSIPGEVRLAEAQCVLSAETAVWSARFTEARFLEECAAMSSGGGVAVVRRDAVEGALAVRNRRRGDAFRPLGLGGRKKLQDLFVDRKVPRGDRDRIPIVVDDTDRIIWVAGHEIDEAFRVTDASQGVVIFRIETFTPSGEARS